MPVQTPKEPISPEAARYLLSIDFSEADRSRMQELMDKSNEGALTPDEDAELEGYVLRRSPKLTHPYSPKVIQLF